MLFSPCFLCTPSFSSIQEMHYRFGGLFFGMLSLSLLLTLVLSVVAGDAILRDEGTGEVIFLSSKRKHSMSSRQDLLRLWSYGGGRNNNNNNNNEEEEDVFFDEEDTAYNRWALETKQKQRLQQQQKEKDVVEKKRAKDTTRLKSKPKAEESFTSSFLKARSNERRTYLRELKNFSSIQIAWDAVQNASSLLQHLLSDVSPFTPELVVEGTPEEQYIRLMTGVFGHTARNMTSEKGDNWVAEWIYAIPYPMVLHGEALTYAKRELRSIMEDVAVLKLKQAHVNATEEEWSNTENTFLQTDENLRIAASIINASMNAHQMVLTLVHPLIPQIRNNVLSQLQEAEKRITTNDESTLALRRELKEWMKRKNSLKIAQNKIISTERSVRIALHSNTLLSKDSFVASLALIARARLGKSTGIDGLDMVSDLGLCTAITAALETELTQYLCFPLGFGVAIAALTSWLLLRTRRYWVNWVRRSRLQKPEAAETAEKKPQHHRRRSVSFEMLGLRLNLLVEAAVPLIIPLIVLHYFVKRNEMPLYPIFLFAQPSQRLALGWVVLAFLLLSTFQSSLTNAMYRCVVVKKAQRQEREKKKNS